MILHLMYEIVLGSKSRSSSSLLRHPDGSHWLDSENHLFTLEATGYALLALVKLGRMEEAAAPFKWLNSQRRRGGGFGSTQVPEGGIRILAWKTISSKKLPNTLFHIINPRSDLNIQFSLTAIYQSTMVVLQALSEYMIHQPPPADLSLDVDIKLTGRKDIRYHFNPDTAYAARSSRVRHFTKQVELFSIKQRSQRKYLEF